MLISDVMTRNPVTVSSTTTTAQAMKMLYELDVRHLPVVDEGEVVGIVSDRDFRGLVVDELAAMVEPEAVSSALEAAISTLMSSDVVTVADEDELRTAIDVMLEERVGAIPVVRQGTAELAGILSYVDVLRALRSTG